MRTLVLAIASLTIMTGTVALAPTAQARAPMNWCSRIQGNLNCMYRTLGQCRASVSGRAGTCVQNPGR